MIARLIVRLNLEPFSNGINNLVMLFHGLRWDWPPLERKHSGTVRLVHDRFGDSRDVVHATRSFCRKARPMEAFRASRASALARRSDRSRGRS
jgi:hypothetical protein